MAALPRTVTVGRLTLLPRLFASRSPPCVSPDRPPFPLSGGGAIRHILRRNVGAMVGLAVLALAAVAAASLATWTVDDPSLSHATDHAIRNVLGFPGAIISDLLTQLLGLAASLLLLPPVVWAWRAVFAQPTRLHALDRGRPGSPAR